MKRRCYTQGSKLQTSPKGLGVGTFVMKRKCYTQGSKLQKSPKGVGVEEE